MTPPDTAPGILGHVSTGLSIRDDGLALWQEEAQQHLLFEFSTDDYAACMGQLGTSGQFGCIRQRPTLSIETCEPAGFSEDN